MKVIRTLAATPAHWRALILSSLAALACAGLAPAAAQESGVSQEKVKPLLRVMAASDAAVQADEKAFHDEFEATEISKLMALKGVTPASPILDNCDRISALADRADAIGKRYPDYLAIGRKQGEAEVAAAQLGPADVDAYMKNMAGQQARHEQGWALTGKMTREVAALCTVLARRHWRIGSAGQIEVDDPDKAELINLLESVQADGQQLAVLEQERQRVVDEGQQILSKAR
jgi:hypothetical protein